MRRAEVIDVPIESAPYYFAVCDLCAVNITEGSGDYSAWKDDSAAIDSVNDAYGYVGPDGVILCNECLNRYKPELPDEEWDAMDRQDPEAVVALNLWLAEAKKEKAA